jgi:P4 family phage/plasmid primase-like protien
MKKGKMTPTQMAKQYYEFMNSHRVTDKNLPHTHTRIPTKSSNRNLFGGKFNIPHDELDKFYELYYNHVFINKNEEHLTEVQLKNDTSPILIDLDLRYDIEITQRPHENNEEFKLTMIEIYMNNLKKILDFKTDIVIPVYIFEKPDVNIDKENSRTKDGVHMIIGIQLCHRYQSELRKMVLKDIQENEYTELTDLPITNSWDTVLDETISRGSTNWQLYGSNKPLNQKYQLERIINLTYEDDGEFSFDNDIEVPIIAQEKRELFNRLSAQYCGNPFFEPNEEFVKSLDKSSSSGGSTRKNRRVRTSNSDKLILSKSGDYSEITCEKDLDELIDDFLTSTIDSTSSEYSFRDIYMYVMILPEEYYTDRNKWIEVGWALKNIDFRMFTIFMKFSCQWSEFSFSDIPERFDEWQKYEVGDDCKTKGSIVYWAREYWNNKCREDPDIENKFDEIYRSSIDYYVHKSIEEPEDYNFAMVLFKMYGDRYKCADIKNNIWYEFVNNRWVETNNATTLYVAISTKQYELYNTKLVPMVTKLQSIEDEDDPEWNDTKRIIGTLRKICDKMKNCTSKEKILKESKHLFYDKDFYSLLDMNPYIFGFKNGVVDFTTNKFRQGTKDDYLTKSCKLKFIPKEEWDPTIVSQINQYMDQLFPEKEICKYMWEFLGSVPLGKDPNQTFNNFYGKGQNGKSKFIEILGSLLGDYYEIVPEAYVTGKRSSVEGTQSSIAKLKGVRLACINEPSEGDSLNEGVMKELTGGDEIIARQLHKEAIRFKPQFNLVVATNHLFKIKSQDDGTWRRFRIVPFATRFVVEKLLGVKYSWEDNPHQFCIDYQLDIKLASKNFKDTFISMIVHKTFETDGVVEDVPIVMKETDKYRNGEDFFASFISDKILYEEGSGITVKKNEVHNEFQEWFKQNIGGKPPSSSKLYNVLDNKYGPHNRKTGWRNIKIIYDNDDEDDDVIV